jgi:L-threonylcarbamoyladenylate synthase
MQVVNLKEVGIEATARSAAAALGKGGVIIFPTDTLYGLGADAFSDEAVARIYTIKGRDEKKPIHAIVSDLEMAGQYGIVDDMIYQLAEKLPKGKVTFVVKKKPGVDTGIARSIETFGFRIPDSSFCRTLAGAFGRPLTATSANRSGQDTPRDLSGIIVQLGSDTGIDLAIDAGALPASSPSTVVDVSTGEAIILREGAVSKSEIEHVLGF